MNSIPTKKEINVFDSPDEKSAVKNFLGKDLSEAEKLFRKNFLVYQEDLMWMGEKAFSYYVVAAINYLRTVDLNIDDESDFEAFFNIIAYRLDSEQSFKKIAKACLLQPVQEMLQLKISSQLNDKINSFLKKLNV